MLIYIARRLAWTVLVILVVLFITFLVFFKLPNGDPALRFAGKSPTPEQLALIRQRLNLDKPFYEEFGYFVWHFVARRRERLARARLLLRQLRAGEGSDRERAPRTLWLIFGAADVLARARRRHRRALGGQAADR